MINWFDIPDEGLSNGGLFEVKELEVTENGTYETKGEMYNKVTVNVEGGGGESDLSIATVTIVNNSTGGWGLSGVVGSNKGRGFLVLQNDEYLISLNEGVSRQSTVTLQAILMPQEGEMGALYGITGNGTPTVTGNAEYYEEDALVYITGDCTITIS